ITTGQYWLLTDQQGTVRDVTGLYGSLRKHSEYDAAGKVTSVANYDEYGHVANPSQVVDELFGFEGGEYEQAIGLVRKGNRIYSQDAARFLSEAPSGFAGGDVNLYRLAANSFPNGTDPTGLSLASPLTALAKSAGTALVNTATSYAANLYNGVSN